MDESIETVSVITSDKFDDASSTGRVSSSISRRNDIENSETGIISAGTDATDAAGNLQQEDEEIPYDKGATDLYMSIEACEWDKALRLCRERPDQAAVWIKSTGTDNTVFNWSVWRRLPIHEACRRQPPPVLISSLLAIYPESAYLVTHFGELPIHLAVGCGACPEVVNLLIAANPNGVIAVDNGGRHAIEIMEENGAMRDDSHVSRESIERCRVFLDNLESEWEGRIVAVQNEHREELATVARKHQHNLSVKDDDITNLKKEVQRTKDKSSDLCFQIDERERKIESKNKIERNLMEHVHKLEDEISELRSQNRTLRNRVAELEDTVLENEGTVEKLTSRADTLSTDMVNMCMTNDSIVAAELRRAEADLKKMIESQRLFFTRIKHQKESVRSLLTDRDIPLPALPMPSTPARPLKEPATPPRSPNVEHFDHTAAAASARLAARKNLNVGAASPNPASD